MPENLETRVKNLEDRVAALEATASPAGELARALPSKQQSPKEFLLIKAPRSAVQRTLALAYYYESAMQRGAFNIGDLEAIFRAAKEKLPANMNDMVNKNIKKGYLMEDAAKKDDKKAWVLTATGEKFVESNFGEE